MHISIADQAEIKHQSTKSGLRGVLKEYNFDLYLNARHQYNKTQGGGREREREKYIYSEPCKLQHKTQCLLPTNYFFCGLVTALSQRDGTCGMLNE